ncbi:MAG: zinc ribbon domain-containing protein [Blautia massiliensis (ex Durand et al. 2017)]
MHSKNGGKYVAWCCGKHIDDVTACSMKFIRNADVEKAFVTMMNKLVYGRRFVHEAPAGKSEGDGPVGQFPA